MPAYEPILPFEVLSQQLGRPADQIIKLDANENPYGPLACVFEALAHLPYAHVYPDPGSRALRAALSSFHSIPEENLLAGAGADELIDLVLRLLVEPGDALLNCPPTFGMYAFDGDLAGARVISIPRLPDFSVDIQAINEAVRVHRPKLLFLASPNNPDGSLVDGSVLERLLDLPLILVLDEPTWNLPPGASRLKYPSARTWSSTYFQQMGRVG
jgi:histidinol-phosphate aminotransferase